MDSNADIKKEAGGEKIPDSLIIEVDSTDPSYITIRSCDFKFNLEMAQYRQVHPKTLSGLLERSELARSAVQSAIIALQKAGKIQGDFLLSDKLPEDQSQTDFLALDVNKRIRAVTGRFISPNTEENRNYFNSRGKIDKKNVYTRELIPAEIDKFLVDFPGYELAQVVENLSVGATMTNFDERLIKARIAAAMNAKGITSVEQFKQYMEKPENFKDPAKDQKPDISADPDVKRFLEPKLRNKMPEIESILKGTIGQSREERMSAITQAVTSFGLSPEITQEILRFLESYNW